VQFTRLIPVQGRLHEFNFRQRTPDSYEVNVPDDRGDRHYFKFMKQDDNWQIFGDRIPIWLQGMEAAIEKAINEQPLY
jgi:hypothetical protein